jgi:hypothetical protein
MTAAEMMYLLAKSKCNKFDAEDRKLFPGIKDESAMIFYREDGRIIVTEKEYVEIYSRSLDVLGQFELKDCNK